jgi:hypothetical protein
VIPYHNHRGDQFLREHFEAGAARLVAVVAVVTIAGILAALSFLL